MPKIVITHSVADVDTWLKRNSERAAAIGVSGAAAPARGGCSMRRRFASARTTSTSRAASCPGDDQSSEPGGRMFILRPRALYPTVGVIMTGRRHIAVLMSLVLAAFGALDLAGCGGGGQHATASSQRPQTASGQTATLSIADTSLGKILVDSWGHTLYLFKADAPTVSACTGPCAAAWPPLLADGKPTVGGGVNASLVGTIPRPGIARQLTYNGHPLYLFEGDQKPGEVNGQGVIAFGAPWYVLSAAGDQVSSLAANPAATRWLYQ
jgi:predicted lipoprotein with Yx(FWY)xxD motif